MGNNRLTPAVLDSPAAPPKAMRKQTACNLTVRFAWDVAADQNHPDYTFTCAQDLEMAVAMSRRASEMAPRGIGFLAAAVSTTGGRGGPWEPLDLEAQA